MAGKKTCPVCGEGFEGKGVLHPMVVDRVRTLADLMEGIQRSKDEATAEAATRRGHARKNEPAVVSITTKEVRDKLAARFTKRASVEGDGPAVTDEAAMVAEFKRIAQELGA